MPHLRVSSVHIRRRTTQAGQARYDVRYRRGGRYFPVEHAGTFSSMKEARIRRDLVAGWLAGNQDPAKLLKPDAQPVTVNELAREWLASKVSVSPATLRNYARHLDHASETLGPIPVVDLSPTDIRRHVAVLSETLAPGTVSMHLNTLRAALDSADLAANPARHRTVEKPRRVRRDLEPPDALELEQILARLAFQYRPVLLIMEQAALRVTEVLSLTPDDILTGEIRVRRETTKTGRARNVPCPQWLTGLLEPPYTMTRQGCWNRLADAADLAGVPRYGPHQWRHRRATLWHLQGVPAVEVSRRLGHAKVSITLDTYTHARPVREADPQRLASFLM